MRLASAVPISDQRRSTRPPRTLRTRNFIVFRIDYDTQKPLWQSFGVTKQSTLIGFHGTRETGRIAYESDEMKVTRVLAQTSADYGSRLSGPCLCGGSFHDTVPVCLAARAGGAGCSARRNWYGPVALAAGLVVAFAAVGFIVAAFGAALGIDSLAVRQAGSVVDAL